MDLLGNPLLKGIFWLVWQFQQL